MWLMRKDQCMHCEDPGCLRACPADGAIVQYTNGIVDFQQENCIGCQYCVSGMPVRHSEVQLGDQEGLQVHAVLGSRRAGARAGVHQVVSDRLPEVRHEGRHARARRETRARQLREHSGFANAGVYDPPSVGGTHVIYVLHDVTKPELYGGLPANPTDSRDLHGVEAVREAGRAAAGAARRAGRVLPLHRRGTEGAAAADSPGGSSAMTTAVERFDDEARAPRRRARADHGHDGELLRHPVYTRVLHWAVAIFFSCRVACPASRSTRPGCIAG